MECGLHQRDGNPFAWAATIGFVIVAAVGNKVERTFIPLAKTLWPERCWIFLLVQIVVGAVQV